MNQITYSNPRVSAQIIDRSSFQGAQPVTTAVFEVEMDAKRGQRAVCMMAGRIIRKLPFAKFVRIVDGDDGKLYIVALSFAGNILIWGGTMRRPHEIVQADELRHSDLLTLFVRENV